ncbi:MAG: hypothetical protein ACI4F0_00020 [Agathobacter sp.]
MTTFSTVGLGNFTTYHTIPEELKGERYEYCEPFFERIGRRKNEKRKSSLRKFFLL